MSPRQVGSFLRATRSAESFHESAGLLARRRHAGVRSVVAQHLIIQAEFRQREQPLRVGFAGGLRTQVFRWPSSATRLPLRDSLRKSIGIEVDGCNYIGRRPQAALTKPIDDQ